MKEDLAPVFKALADPNRRRLLDALHETNGQSLNELSARLDISRQGVTQHLDVLERAGLVVTLWRGRAKHHYLNPVPIIAIAERWIHKFERGRLTALRALKAQLEEEVP